MTCVELAGFRGVHYPAAMIRTFLNRRERLTTARYPPR
jgi:hypothetical protein